MAPRSPRHIDKMLQLLYSVRDSLRSVQSKMGIVVGSNEAVSQQFSTVAGSKAISSGMRCANRRVIIARHLPVRLLVFQRMTISSVWSASVHALLSAARGYMIKLGSVVVVTTRDRYGSK